MSMIFIALVALAVISASWFWFESRWDRRIFATSEDHVCENLRPRAAMDLLQSRKDVQVLDVRSASEFAGGALPDAVNISIRDPNFREAVAQLAKTKPVLVYCAGGFRSRKAVEVLRELEFESIYHLHRGYHSWQLTGLPTARVVK